jgi:hypothetical protein
MFSEEDKMGVSLPHDDASIITMTVANHIVHQKKIDRDIIKLIQFPLIGFAGERVQPMGVVPVTVETTPGYNHGQFSGGRSPICV